MTRPLQLQAEAIRWDDDAMDRAWCNTAAAADVAAHCLDSHCDAMHGRIRDAALIPAAAAAAAIGSSVGC